MGKILVDTLALIGGAAAGAYLNNILTSSFATLPKAAPAAATTAAGLVVERLAKNNAALQNVGTGMAAAGGLFLLNETVLSLPGISGMGFVTNYDLARKTKPALSNRVGAAGFMDTAIGAAKDLTPIAGPQNDQYGIYNKEADAMMMGILDN